MSVPSSSVDHDVIIIGGGMAGASLACALSKTGKRVAIIEAQPIDHGREAGAHYDDRTVALSYGSRKIFEHLGLWSGLEAFVEPIETIHISDRGHFGVTRLRHTEERVEALGYVAENRGVMQVLYQHLLQDQHIDLIDAATVQSIDQDEDSVQIELGDGRSLTARLLVAADGVSSAVRKLLHIGVSQKSYRQCAVIANVTPGKPHRRVAYERFTENGPIAFLPMQEQRCAVVWTMPSVEAESLVELDDASFIGRLQESFGYRLGQISRAGKRQLFPLALVESTQVVRGRIVVVGNAAHNLHPVAGQGFNLALRDVTCLAELIESHEDAGDATLLASYETERRKDAESVFRFTDGLIKLFANADPVLGHLRSAGLMVVDLMPPMKHLLATHSMGLASRMSALGRVFADGANR